MCLSLCSTRLQAVELQHSETVVQRYSVKKVFLKMSLNSQKSTCVRPEDYNFVKRDTLAQVFSCEFYEISKNAFFYRTPLVAASK